MKSAVTASLISRVGLWGAAALSVVALFGDLTGFDVCGQSACRTAVWDQVAWAPQYVPLSALGVVAFGVLAVLNDRIPMDSRHRPVLLIGSGLVAGVGWFLGFLQLGILNMACPVCIGTTVLATVGAGALAVQQALKKQIVTAGLVGAVLASILIPFGPPEVSIEQSLKQVTTSISFRDSKSTPKLTRNGDIPFGYESMEGDPTVDQADDVSPGKSGLARHLPETKTLIPGSGGVGVEVGTGDDPASPPIVLEVFSSVSCSHCGRFEEVVLPKLREQAVSVRYRAVLRPGDPIGATAEVVLMAGRYLNRYDAFRERLFGSQDYWLRKKDPIDPLYGLVKLTEMEQVITTHGPDIQRRLKSDQDRAKDLGVMMTPTVVLWHTDAPHDRIVITGVKPVSVYEEAITRLNQQRKDFPQ